MTELMVRAENVHKRFGTLEALKSIDLQVTPGEVMVIVGPSGSGKTTFLRCVDHLEKIDAGRLYVDSELVWYRERGGKLDELGPAGRIGSTPFAVARCFRRPLYGELSYYAAYPCPSCPSGRWDVESACPREERQWP
jgi:ABC-type branched-subunit amino acid transport system ATPase component